MCLSMPQRATWTRDVRSGRSLAPKANEHAAFALYARGYSFGLSPNIAAVDQACQLPLPMSGSVGPTFDGGFLLARKRT
jgi:hypothetical protein